MVISENDIDFRIGKNIFEHLHWISTDADKSDLALLDLLAERGNRLVDNLRHFAIGASWGGYESLITREYPARSRTATTWQAAGPVLRIHAGLEDPDDLIADLEAGLDRLRSAAP